MSETGTNHAIVMVVDDEPFIRDIFIRALPEYRVLQAQDGEEALALIDKEKPRIVLLDIKMPKMDGIEVLKRIKEKDKRIAVIIVSAFGTNELTEKAMDLGAESFITKPFRINKIKAIISGLLEQ